MLRKLYTLAKTYKPFDKTTAKGVYLSVVPNEKALASLVELSASLGLPLSKAEQEELHCTVVYSKAIPECIDSLSASLDPGAAYEVRIVGLEWWGGHDNAGYVVLRLQSPALAELNREWLAAGCTSSHAGYNPHITLKKDVGPRPEDFYERRKAVYPFIGTNFCMTNPTVESTKH